MSKTLVETQTGTAKGQTYSINVWKLEDRYEIEALDESGKPLNPPATLPLEKVHADAGKTRYDLINDTIDAVEDQARVALGDLSPKE